jgi:epoxyqueuosine reductase
MNRAALGERIKTRGAELGFAAVGIAALEPSRHRDELQRWLARGDAGTMGWMERTAAIRGDPRERFPWARTAVVTATSYLPDRAERGDRPGLARHVSRYALGPDYHATLGGRLGRLARFIETEVAGARTRLYVDTGPLLERELAARAGLGWFGKSTNLIGPRGNSWILLGEILTDIELPPDAPVADHCGSCTACIDACPTGAIVEPYRVDSRRCISYLTIELRDAIPTALRPGLGDWVFGCDVCQEVCPWNRKVAPADDAAFRPGRHLTEEDLTTVLALDEESFRSRFRDTPLQRPRRRGLARNALIVAGNTHDGRALQAAERRLGDDPDPVVRGAAAWALGRAAGTRSRMRLERARGGEPDAEVRREIEAALQTGETPAASVRE